MTTANESMPMLDRLGSHNVLLDACHERLACSGRQSSISDDFIHQAVAIYAMCTTVKQDALPECTEIIGGYSICKRSS